MAQLDYSYYRDVFNGKLGEEEFQRYFGGACDAVDMLAGRKISDGGSPYVLRALCFQTELMAEGADNVTKETAGELSITYGSPTRLTSCGVPISPFVVSTLSAGGFLGRWT